MPKKSEKRGFQNGYLGFPIFRTPIYICNVKIRRIGKHDSETN